MVGRKVSPVLADPNIKRSDLPGWIRRADVYDVAEPERWRMLVRVLEGPGETRRVPYMSGDLPDDFVPRLTEYAALKDAVLSAPSGGPVGVTTALRGAGGYGKTTLANALCRDPEVRFEFTDGILRVEIGKERGDVTGLIVDLIEKLDPNARRPGFQDVETATEHLGQLIGEARLLMVIDDVWREAQLRPFLRGGPNCVRLVTTRLPQVLPRSAKPIVIDEMRAAEAFGLISANLPVAGNPVAQRRLARLAERLGHWAQMIGIANGWIHDRVSTGEPIAKAIERFEQRLKKRGLAAFDPEDEPSATARFAPASRRAWRTSAPMSSPAFASLPSSPRKRTFRSMSSQRSGRKPAASTRTTRMTLMQRFHALSLLQSLERGARTLRLHDNMIWYLRDRIGRRVIAPPMRRWCGRSGRAATATGQNFPLSKPMAGAFWSGIFAPPGRTTRPTRFLSTTPGSGRSCAQRPVGPVQRLSAGKPERRGAAGWPGDRALAARARGESARASPSDLRQARRLGSRDGEGDRRGGEAGPGFCSTPALAGADASRR